MKWFNYGVWLDSNNILIFCVLNSEFLEILVVVEFE